VARVISIHEYELKPGVDPEVFERTFKRADQEGLFDLPGLIDYVLLRGMKGHRRNQYTVLWVYQDRAAWERLWGPPDDPYGPESYPERWKSWERDFLAPLLETDPDHIHYTSYDEIENGAQQDTSQ
jgi:hypothetical protein